MERLSPQSMLNAVGLSGETQNTSPTPQRGSTREVGLTSQEAEKARAWLGTRKPAETDQAIRHSLTSQLGVSVNVNREWRYPEGKPPYQVTTSAGIQAQSRANVLAAIGKVEFASVPPSHEEAELMVSQLQQVLARRASSEEAAEVGFDAYVHCLRRHPLDVAQAAVMELANEPRVGNAAAWFPTLPELEGVCRKYGGDREAMLEGLRGWRAPKPELVEVRRLEQEWKALRQRASDLNMKVGPGPATDTGARGERLAAAYEAEQKSMAAREAYLAAEKALQ
jgi:hypothetical protein